MPVPQLRSFGACSGFLIDTCPLGTRRNQVTYYMALIGVLLWEAAGLRRDAIASYICTVYCNSKLNNSKSQAKPRIIHRSALPLA